MIGAGLRVLCTCGHAEGQHAPGGGICYAEGCTCRRCEPGAMAVFYWERACSALEARGRERKHRHMRDPEWIGTLFGPCDVPACEGAR